MPNSPLLALDVDIHQVCWLRCLLPADSALIGDPGLVHHITDRGDRLHKDLLEVSTVEPTGNTLLKRYQRYSDRTSASSAREIRVLLSCQIDHPPRRRA
jgi:hypothetical protein